MLGLSLGLLFTPCAGPVIAAVATVAATQELTLSAFAITLVYGLGAGLVLLGFALAGRRGLNLAGARAHAPAIRRALGAAVLAVAVLMVLGVDKRLQTRVPEYTRALQGLEESAAAAGGAGGPRRRAGARGGGAARRLRHRPGVPGDRGLDQLASR